MSHEENYATRATQRNPLEPFGDDLPSLGEDVFVHPSSAVIGQVILGDRVSIWPQVTLRADEGVIRIGQDSNIQDGSTLHMTGGYSHTMIGERVTVGHMCLLHGCQVGDDCLIGMGSILLDNCKIGEGSYVAAGTMITGNKVIPPHSFVMGRPGSLVVKPLPELRAQEMGYSWRHYVDLAARYLSQASGTLTLLLLMLWGGMTTGCAPVERPSLVDPPRKHHVTLSSLERMRFDGMLFSETEYDPFTHQRGVLALTQTPPTTINYRTFGAPTVDSLLHKSFTLYAQYCFALNAVERFRRDVVQQFGKEALEMSPEDLQQLISGEPEPVSMASEDEQVTQTSGDQVSGDSEFPSEPVGQSQQEGDDSEVSKPVSDADAQVGELKSKVVLPTLTRGSRAVRLSIATHRELVNQTLLVQAQLNRIDELITADIERDMNLSAHQGGMKEELERARGTISDLLSGLPHLSKAIKEVDSVTAALP